MDTSYLATQVTTIVGQLHGIFDEIGVPKNEREARETELFTALSETLHNQLRLVNTEKTEITEEAQKIIKTIKQMEASLEGSNSRGDYDLETGDLRVSYPLNRCLQGLKERYNNVSKAHRERFEQVKKLVQALESYSSHLEPSFIKISLPPTTSNTCPPNFDLSQTYVTSLDAEFTKVYEEYTHRVATVKTTAEEIIKLWAELGTPQAQTDSSIVKYYRDSPEQLGLHESDLAKLKGKRDKLINEKKGRERRLQELKATVESLWDRLGVEEPDRKQFLAANRGCGLRTINEFEDELARLNELKRQNLHLFVEDARCRLQELWDGLYFSEEEMLDFTPAFSDVYSDALLSAHEAEIARLQALKEQRAPTLELVDKHRSIIADRESLAASAQDASRLMLRGTKGEKRDPTRLLREEKMRKRIAKELPKVEAELRKILEQWEDEYGRPFLVHGERYLDEIAAAQARAPPPRSKTPSGPPPVSRNASAKPTPAPSRAGSVARAPPPPRSTTKTPTNFDTMRRIPQPISSTVPANKSPSRIPARVPLSNKPNSPPKVQAQNDGSSTIRKMGPPRAPPPKMRDLFVPPQDQTPMMGYANEPPSRSESVLSSNDSVRPMSPEDVYDDRERMSYMSASIVQHNKGNRAGAAHSFQDFHSSTQARYDYPVNPSQSTSRQISNSSSNLTANTGTTGSSENWETFDDASEIEPEIDARAAYHAKVRSAGGKRVAPDGLYNPSAKMRGRGVNNMILEVEEGGELVRVEGSDAGWTDDQETF